MSPLKSILVHVDSSPHCPARLALAHQLAEAHDSTVTALFAPTPVDLQFPFGVSPGLEVTTMANALESKRRDLARKHVDAALNAGLTRLQWAELPREQGLIGFTRAAMVADLVLMGQHDPGLGAAQDVPADYVEWTLNDCGRPVLVVPYTLQHVAPMRIALVAWKPCREAARALNASLPLLQQADEVHVAMWDDSQMPQTATDAGPLQAYLQNHGISAQLHQHGPATPELGDHLLSMAADLDAGLLVMGCYGHARIREWVTGGVTRTVMSSMTLPVLMSH